MSCVYSNNNPEPAIGPKCLGSETHMVAGYYKRFSMFLCTPHARWVAGILRDMPGCVLKVEPINEYQE